MTKLIVFTEGILDTNIGIVELSDSFADGYMKGLQEGAALFAGRINAYRWPQDKHDLNSHELKQLKAYIDKSNLNMGTDQLADLINKPRPNILIDSSTVCCEHTIDFNTDFIKVKVRALDKEGNKYGLMININPNQLYRTDSGYSYVRGDLSSCQAYEGELKPYCID